MIGDLENNLNVINSIIKSIKDYISYFWQPSMSNNYQSTPVYNNSKYRRPKKEIDKNKHLDLDNVMVLKVSNNGNEDYMITMLGLRQDNCDERILIRNGRRTEKSVIDMCLQQNLELDRKPVSSYMTEEEIELYDQALRVENYHYCLSYLCSLETNMNSLDREQRHAIQLRLKHR